MKSYRDRYDELTTQKTTIIAVSSDKEARQAEFRRTIGAEFSFVSDPKGDLIKKFGVKTPLVTFAKRTTFVIGKDRKVLHVETGKDAVDGSGAAEACSLF
jgi:peroxiredoxin Q/BCP